MPASLTIFTDEATEDQKTQEFAPNHMVDKQWIHLYHSRRYCCHRCLGKVPRHDEDSDWTRVNLKEATDPDM